MGVTGKDGRAWQLAGYGFLVLNSLIALYPVFIMVMSGFKTLPEIMFAPLALPKSWSLANYAQVWYQAGFNVYFKNSLLVSILAVATILTTGSIAAYVLGRYRFRGNTLIYSFFLVGLTLPIKLGILPLFMLIRSLHLFDTLGALVLIYTAIEIPFSVFILTGFFRSLPVELEEAARLDGCGDFAIFYRIMLPLVRPALATVGIFAFDVVWNDFFFPLIFLRSDGLKTLPLGLTVFFGEYQTNWSMLFAGLTLSTIPLIIVFLFASKQFIGGLTAGAVKG